MDLDRSDLMRYGPLAGTKLIGRSRHEYPTTPRPHDTQERSLEQGVAGDARRRTWLAGSPGKPLEDPYRHLKPTRRGTMRSSLVEDIGKPGANLASFNDPAKQAALVAAAKRGDELAFEILVKHNQPKIFAIALRYTRVQEDAEDVTQRTFQKAFVYMRKFEGKSSFSTWLTRIAINEALMLLRRGRALREVRIDDSSSEGTTLGLKVPDTSPDPEARYLRREEAQILAAAMRRLRSGMRRALELRELRELTAQQTARRMGLSVSAVKARVFHGRRKLGEAVRRYMRPRRVPRSNLLAVAGNANRISQIA